MRFLSFFTCLLIVILLGPFILLAVTGILLALPVWALLSSHSWFTLHEWYQELRGSSVD